MPCSSSSGSQEDEGVDAYREGRYQAVRIGNQFAGWRYVAQRKLGWGHFSTVCLAYDTRSQTILHLEGLDGDLKRTRRPKFWLPLDKLLVEKYKFPEADACKFTEFLYPYLTLLQKIGQPQHPWLRIKDAKPRGEQNEAIVGKLEVGMTKLKVQVN
ncbi:uncharacterized protein LOC122036484 [Zingiber officinale]|uniref:non-specific serine/threonine protein kinase n=1 Tax=Zingiber officinale TaxID=94328 RepID=A0A8J5EMG7_ZINOF|nr:uncharacterized protein LOC122036484 [Zingiber officinale]KAG6466290.1 hypothetical protein ZIOFF_075899 [Zingiber officinale]